MMNRLWCGGSLLWRLMSHRDEQSKGGCPLAPCSQYLSHGLAYLPVAEEEKAYQLPNWTTQPERRKTTCFALHHHNSFTSLLPNEMHHN